jgi:hypothetical protein
MKNLKFCFATLFATCLSFGLLAQTTTYEYSGSLENYVVPVGVSVISVQAYGAQGGNDNGGLGAGIYGEFNVSGGQVFNVVVGGQGVVNNCGGPNASSGGGGGSFFWDSTNEALPLIAAGGGGGGNQNWDGDCTNGVPGQAGQDGTSGSEGGAAGGIDGQGGAGDAPSGGGAGGGGWLSNGVASTYDPTATGGATLPDFAGGDGSGTFGPGGEGGFGGGGGAVCGCGGGSGYSGGAGGNGLTCRAGGGGGGSYNAGQNPLNETGIWSGNGQIIITVMEVSSICWETGDGSDGIFHATASMPISGGEYNFSSFIVDDGAIVNVTGNDPLVVHCTGGVEINGTLHANGGAGEDGVTFSNEGVGGTAVAGGSDGGTGIYSDNEGPLDGSDGFGLGSLNTYGVNWSGGGGAGYATTGSSSGGDGGFGGAEYGTPSISELLGGSGGGSGSGGFSCGSGGGGAGGGVIVMFADEISISNTGLISSNGGNGGSDGQGNCGGGGGGSGGTIWLAANNVLNDGVVSALGGTGGSSSFKATGFGGEGSVGRIRVDTMDPWEGVGGFDPLIGYEGGLIDSTVSNDGNTLSVSTGNGNQTYQWIDCDNNGEPIVGEISNTFSPEVSGNFACIITSDPCDLTTDCVDFVYTGIAEIGKGRVHIFPNPASTSINIGTSDRLIQARFYSNTGQLVKLESGNEISTADLASGVYLVVVLTETGNSRHTLIIE